MEILFTIEALVYIFFWCRWAKLGQKLKNYIRLNHIDIYNKFLNIPFFCDNPKDIKKQIKALKYIYTAEMPDSTSSSMQSKMKFYFKISMLWLFIILLSMFYMLL